MEFRIFLFLVTYRKSKPLGAIWPGMTPGQLTVKNNFWGWKGHDPSPPIKSIWAHMALEISFFSNNSYLTGPDPRAGLPLDIVWRWQLIILKTINYSVKRTLCIPFSTTRENSRFLNYRSRLLSLKLIISFAKRFVWWSKLQNRGDGTANQMAQITIPRLQAWQKFQLEIENRIFLNDNVVLQSVSNRLTVTVRHVNKKTVCHLSRISSLPNAFVSYRQKKTKMIFIEVIEGSKKNSNHQNTTRDCKRAIETHENLELVAKRSIISPFSWAQHVILCS